MEASPLRSTWNQEGNISFDKAAEIAEMPLDIQPSVIEKVVKENLSLKETTMLVQAIIEQPERMDEIISGPISKLALPPLDIKKFDEKYGQKQTKFEKGRCPDCGAEYVINWVLNRMNWRHDQS